MDDEARRWIVHGHVQGVGFRLYVLREAKQLRLRGKVRNTTDGAVEVVAHGSLDALNKLGRLLQQGPPASRVSSVDTQQYEGSAESLPADFAIEN